MMLTLNNICLEFPHKICFRDFSATVPEGARVGIIGRNGCGKSSLLKMIYQQLDPQTSFLVPQCILENSHLSGGERFNKKLSEAMAQQAEYLLLDEPTNHLDLSNRKSLLRMLQNYPGTLFIVTHDIELLNHCIGTIWHIYNEKITIFHGAYEDFLKQNKQKQKNLQRKIEELKLSQKKLQSKLQKEQERQAHARAIGKKKVENKRWTKMVGHEKSMSAEKSTGKRFQNLAQEKSKLLSEFENIFIPEEILPRFNFVCSKKNAHLSITEGAVGYKPNQFVLEHIHLQLDRNLAIIGPNASGKTTLIKAIMGDLNVLKWGQWRVPSQIAYLDQHYASLNLEQTPIDILSKRVPTWSHSEIRKYLNDFLFRKNEEIHTPVKNLSGGEKARLCLAHIMLVPPILLILDEITNNIDLETKQHIIEILRAYQGAYIIISHEPEFLKAIQVQDYYEIIPGKTLKRV